MNNSLGKFIVAGLVATAGLCGTFSAIPQSAAVAGDSYSSYNDAYWYKGDKYYCKDFSSEPSDHEHGYYHYCVRKKHHYYISSYDDNYHQYYKENKDDNNHDDGGGYGKKHHGKKHHGGHHDRYKH